MNCTGGQGNRTAGITLIKDVVPNNGDDFELDIDGPDTDDANDTTVADGESISVPSGAIVGDDVLNEGYAGGVTLNPNQSVTCTFTNTNNAVVPIPTLGEWGLILLGGLLSLFMVMPGLRRCY